jgi:hypothetical protein
MKKFLCFGALAGLLSVSSGCSSMQSAMDRQSNHWLVRNKGLQMMGMGLILSSEVFYCPSGGGDCVKATFEE